MIEGRHLIEAAKMLNELGDVHDQRGTNSIPDVVEDLEIAEPDLTRFILKEGLEAVRTLTPLNTNPWELASVCLFYGITIGLQARKLAEGEDA